MEFQKGIWPTVGEEDVESVPMPVMVTAPVAPEREMPAPATLEVTPEFVMVRLEPPTRKPALADREMPAPAPTVVVATVPSFGIVPDVVFQKANCPAVSEAEVATLPLKAVQSAAARQPKTELVAVLQVTVG